MWFRYRSGGHAGWPWPWPGVPAESGRSRDMTAVSGAITPGTAVKGTGSLAGKTRRANRQPRAYRASPANRALVRDERLADVTCGELVLFRNPHIRGF